MSGVQHVEVKDGEAGRRIDRWFKDKFPTLPRGRLEKLLRTGQVRLDGKRVKSSARIEGGQIIRIPPIQETSEGFVPPKRPTELNPSDKKFIQDLVIYEDSSVIVLNKPSGIAVQGGTKTTRHIDGLLVGLADKDGERPRLVHRLDRDTSGVMVLGKTAKAAAALTKAFQSRKTYKIYWALCLGAPRPAAGEINAPLAKSGTAKNEKVIVPEDEAEAKRIGAKRALTQYRTVASAGRRISWMAMRPVTGRTHQLRAHAAYMNFPIVGDGKYGGSEVRLGQEFPKGMMLHARFLEIPHPEKKGTISVRAPLPPHMEEAFASLGFEEADGFDTRSDFEDPE